MKNIPENSTIKGLKYIIDLTLILQFIGVIAAIVSLTFLLMKSPTDVATKKDSSTMTMSSPVNGIMMAFSNPNLAENLPSIKNRFNICCNLCGLINIIALILITLQLRDIFKTFSQTDYFNQSNAIRIRKIAAILFIWVIADYSIRFIPGIIIPHYFVSSSIGVNSFRHGVLNGIFGFNLKILIVSIIIYVLSYVFNYGNKLEEESTLTI